MCVYYYQSCVLNVDDLKHRLLDHHGEGRVLLIVQNNCHILQRTVIPFLLLDIFAGNVILFPTVKEFHIG